MSCICSALLYLFIILVPILYFYVVGRNKKRQAEFEASHGIAYHPLPGFTTTFLKKLNVEQVKYEKIKKVGKVFGFRLFFQDTILIADPELIQLVMSKEFTNFTNRRPFAVSDPVFKHFVSFTNDEVWKRQRAIITPTFSTGKLRNMMPRLRITLNTLMNNLDEAMGGNNSVELDMKRMANAFTMDTIAQTAFGLELDSLKNPNNEIIKHGRKLFGNDLSLKQALKFLAFSTSLRLAEWFKLEFNPDVNRFFGDLVRKVLVGKREMLLRNDFRPTNFIELLLEAEAEYDKQLKLNNQSSDDDCSNKKAVKFMSNDEIVAQCVLFFIAGFETTAATISVTLHELAMNPDVQDKLHEEIESVIATLRPDDDPQELDVIELVSFDDLSKFAYLSAVLDETLRLHSPGPFTERVASKDMKLCTSDGRHELTVLKGDVVHFPIYAIHRDEHNFAEPEVYRPERFLDPVHHNYAYLPFGQGPRNCVAKSFALMEVKLAVLHLVHRYKFTKSRDTKHPVEIFFQSNIHTPKAIPLKIEKRF